MYVPLFIWASCVFLFAKSGNPLPLTAQHSKWRKSTPQWSDNAKNAEAQVQDRARELCLCSLGILTTACALGLGCRQPICLTVQPTKTRSLFFLSSLTEKFCVSVSFWKLPAWVGITGKTDGREMVRADTRLCPRRQSSLTAPCTDGTGWGLCLQLPGSPQEETLGVGEELKIILERETTHPGSLGTLSCSDCSWAQSVQA